jgi:hypothetical protein
MENDSAAHGCSRLEDRAYTAAWIAAGVEELKAATPYIDGINSRGRLSH